MDMPYLPAAVATFSYDDLVGVSNLQWEECQ